jgi:hypothetical protein
MINKQEISSNLLSAVQHLSTETKGQALTDELINGLVDHSKPLMDFFGITHFQAIVFSHLIEAELRSLIFDNERITDTFGRKLSALAAVNVAIEDLIAMKLIYHKRSEYGMRRKSDRNKIISVHDKMLDALMTGDSSLLTTAKTEDFYALLAEVRELIVKRIEKIISSEDLVDQTMQVLISNNTLPEVKWLLKIEGIDKYDMVLLLNLTIETFEDGDGGESDMGKLVNEVFSEIRDRVRYKRSIKENKCPLYTLKLVEFSDSDFSFMDYTRLSDESMEALLGGAVEVSKKPVKPKFGTLIAPDKIEEEELFYNDAEQKQIDTLVNALQKDNYELIVEKLKSKGSIPNFIGIMAGLPGVGKTASCYQIAKRTNRYIYFIDLEKISSKWVGESSRNVKALFDEIKAINASLDTPAVCIFNEAEQVVYRRNNSDSSVSSEKNGVIAQFLQQFEIFSGIAFLTTNLIYNIDPGFMRRILFKLSIKTPAPDVRKKILTKVFDDINHDTIERINSKYELTGAQIGNVSKKLTVSTLLDDTINKDEYIMELCEEEFVFSKSNRKPIGFVQ